MILMPDLSTVPDERGVGYVYYDSMLKYKNKIAQIDGNTGEEQTFGALLKRCIRTAIVMKNKGIRPGDVVSICSYNQLDTCVPYIASQLIGAVMAAVQPSVSVEEIVYLFQQVQPKMIFVPTDALNLVEKVIQELKTEILIVVFGQTAKYVPFSDFVACCLEEEQFKPREANSVDEIALIVFSSGTTGKQKGICHTHESMLANTKILNESSTATLASFTSPYGIVFPMFIHFSVTYGFSRLVFPLFDTNNPWKILNYKINFMSLYPSEAMAYLKHERPETIDIGNLYCLCISGNYISKDDILKIKARFPKTAVLNSYGQTELFQNCFTILTDSKSYELAQKYPDSVGLPVNGVSYKIVDVETDNILGPNKIGELRLKTKWQTKGYYNRDSSETFDSDGWLKTGDLAYYNEESCFFIVDRIKECFKYFHRRILPIQIESVLLEHPAVKQAVVIGLPHETDSNHPLGIVVLKEGHNATENEIIKFVDEKVEDKNRLRAGLKIVKTFPLTFTDKIMRYKLKQMVLNKTI